MVDNMMIPKGFLQLVALYCFLACSQLTELTSSIVHQSKTTYAVIIDCGSSGTRAHIYEWDTDLDYPELLNDIEPKRDQKGEPISKKIEPGLSSVQNDPEKSSDYMKPLIDFVLENIPASSHSSTAIYIMGTAGMRLLDHKTQMKIMTDIVEDLKSRFKFAKVSANVISGPQEGMYEWITVNSKSKKFLTTSGAQVADKTQAIVEMGGSSVQVTYQLKRNLKEFVERVLSNQPKALEAFRSQLVRPEFSKIAGDSNIELFSVSFLGLGGNSARDAYVDLLIDLARKRTEWRWSFSKKKAEFGAGRFEVLKDPCLPEGASETMEKPFRMLSQAHQTIGFNVVPGEKSFEVELSGTGDYVSCRRLLRELLSRAKREQLNCEHDKPCTMSLIGTPFLPFGLFHILGLSEFYYVTSSSMMKLSGRFDRELVIKKTEQICSAPYSKLLKRYPNVVKVDPERVRGECFKATWIDTFLNEALKMPIRFPDFETVGKIKGDQIDWTLGAALDNSFAIENAVEQIEEKEVNNPF